MMVSEVFEETAWETYSDGKGALHLFPPSVEGRCAVVTLREGARQLPGSIEQGGGEKAAWGAGGQTDLVLVVEPLIALQQALLGAEACNPRAAQGT